MTPPDYMLIRLVAGRYAVTREVGGQRASYTGGPGTRWFDDVRAADDYASRQFTAAGVRYSDAVRDRLNAANREHAAKGR